MPPKKGAKKKVAAAKKVTPAKKVAPAKKVESAKKVEESPPTSVDLVPEKSSESELTKQEECVLITPNVVRGNGEDKLSFYARKYWAMELRGTGEFKNEIVKEIFDTELSGVANISRLNLLETNAYLENYLWNNFSILSSFEHVFSIILMINEKFREGSPGFDNITEGVDKFQSFFTKCIEMSPALEVGLTMHQRTSLILFFTNAYQSLENRIVRQCALRYLSLPIWESLTSERLTAELDAYPQIRRHWQHLGDSKAIQNNGIDTDDVEKADVSGSSKSKSTAKRGRSSVGKKGENEANSPNAKKAKSETTGVTESSDATWMPGMLQYFLKLVESDTLLLSAPSDDLTSSIYFLERFCELLIDLLSQLPTRRFLNTVLDDMHLLVRCKNSSLYKSSDNKAKLFHQLIDRIDSYAHFEIHDQSGKALSTQDVMAAYNTRLHKVQQVAYGSFPESLQDVYFSSTGELGKAEKLRSCLALLAPEDLIAFANKLGYISSNFEHMDPNSSMTDFIMDVLLDKLVLRQGQAEELSQLSLIPTESLLWNPNLVPLGSKYNGNQVLSLPKLNLQFLTMHDYLLRNFSLFRLESAYEIRQDLQDSIKRMSPRQSLSGNVSFGGWARMALPIHSMNIEEVLKPALGEVVPARVSCSVEIDISRFQGVIRDEWESLREHDVVFLICIRNPKAEAGKTTKEYENERNSLARGKKPNQTRDFNWTEEDFDFPDTYGVQYVRGGEVFEVRDEDDVILNDFTKPDERKGGRVGAKRRLRLNLDSAQYYNDMTEGVSCYEQLNLLVRRKPKENNFRAILETIRDLMNTAAVGKAVPAWLHDVFLGYGDPSAAHYRNMKGRQEDSTPDSEDDSNGSITLENADYTDTFLDATHLVDSFPEANVSFKLTPEGSAMSLTQKKMTASTRAQLCAPFRLNIQRTATAGADSPKDEIIAIPYKQRNMGPFPQDKRPSNMIRYTPAQVEALRSGMNRGLTMIVGPPGTGKTDVAVQIICNLYHNYPTQKILLVAHSNTALNDLFEKIMQRDVDPRHLLRLGSGEKSLFKGTRGKDAAGNEDVFSKQGRVNWSLARRLQLLSQVQFLAESLDVAGDVGYTCETAEYFQLEHIQSRIEKFNLELTSEGQGVSSIFPFHKYFEHAQQPLFKGEDAKADHEVAMGCFRHVENLFEELSDYRAFELLRTQGHRADYLLTKQARIVAMTCTHAAMTRKRLVQLGFKYDSLVMEEAAQVLEVETLIPMLLQDTDSVDGSRLKRVVLLGDHHQLPPVVQHPAFQRFSHLDQSLFSRFIRLSVPHVQLDQQGRARPEIADLYSWRYNGLGNLPLVTDGGEYAVANAGFAHSFQLINVPAFQGKGEFCPTPHFFQNLGEAEYVVAVYQFMRLIGYPAERISILTTYNGQKNLIRDVISQRCRNPMFGNPSRVTTVDKYQGQQNDFILLSLVRTESVGHLRDIRRLVVAASRARLGLYVFARQSLFENCQELSETFSRLLKKPSVLQLVDGEMFPCTRRNDAAISNTVININDVTAMGVIVYQLTQRALSEAKREDVAMEVVADKSNAVNNEGDDDAEENSMDVED